MRKIFNKVLEVSVQNYDYAYSLKLRKVWNEQDPALYLKREGRFTAQGLNAYWEAIDKTVKFANTILLKKPKGQTRKHQSVAKPQDRKNPSQQYAGNSAKSGDFDRYHWTK